MLCLALAFNFLDCIRVYACRDHYSSLSYVGKIPMTDDSVPSKNVKEAPTLLGTQACMAGGGGIL